MRGRSCRGTPRWRLLQKGALPSDSAFLSILMQQDLVVVRSTLQTEALLNVACVHRKPELTVVYAHLSKSDFFQFYLLNFVDFVAFLLASRHARRRVRIENVRRYFSTMHFEAVWT